MLLLLQIAAGLLVAAWLVLALPVELRFRVRGIEPLQGQVAVRALFGLWQTQLHAPSARRQGRAAAPTRAGVEAAARPARRRTGGLVHLQAFWGDVALRHRILSRLRATLGTLRWSELHLHLRLGLDDPADTGRLWGMLAPLGAGLASLRAADIAIEPDFGGPVLDFDARGRLVLVPLRVLWSLAILAAILGLAMARRHRWRPRRVT